MCQSGASDQPMIRLLCWHGAARAVHLPAFYGDMQTAAAVFAANPALAEDPEALANAAGNGHDGFVRLMAGRPGGRSRARAPAPHRATERGLPESSRYPADTNTSVLQTD